MLSTDLCNVSSTTSSLHAFLQALAKAPATLLESRSRDWVPLLLSYAAAKSSGEAEADAATGRARNAVGGNGGADAVESDSEDEAAAAEPVATGAGASADAAPAADTAGGGALASHVGGQAWRAHLKASSRKLT